MTDKMSREEFEKFIDDLFDEMMEEMKEESSSKKKETVQEPISTCIGTGLSFMQVLEYLVTEYARTKNLDEVEDTSDYYLMAKHPLLEDIYLMLIEECEKDGWKTIIYPYIAAMDKDDNKVEDIHFPKKAWFDRNWSIHRIPLN